MPQQQQPTIRTLRGGGGGGVGKQSTSPLANSGDRDEIADFKERLRIQQQQQQQEELNAAATAKKQKTVDRKGINERDVLLREAQQLLNEDSIIISPSRSLLAEATIMKQDVEDEDAFSDDSGIEEDNQPIPIINNKKVNNNSRTNPPPSTRPMIVETSSLNKTPPKKSPPQKTATLVATTVTPSKHHHQPPTKPITPRASVKVVASSQPDHNPLEVDRQRLVNDRLEDVSTQIAKIEKAISILDQKEREVKSQKREECEKEKTVIREKQTTLENMYSKIDSSQRKQDRDLKTLTREKKKLKEYIMQHEVKKNSLIKERDSLLSIPIDRRKIPIDNKLVQKRNQLLEMEANIERISQLITDMHANLKELENDESEWLAQISTNSMLLEGSALTSDQTKNLMTLIRREKEIYLRTARLREKFPLEIFLIDLKFEFARASQDLISKKKYTESNRQEVCELIEEKRIILEELEQQNFSSKQEYASEKEKGIENLQNELRKLYSLDNFVKTTSNEIEETEAILAQAMELASEEFDFQQVRDALDSFNAIFLSDRIDLSQLGQFRSPAESVVNSFKKLYTTQSQIFVGSEGKKYKEREEYIAAIRNKLAHDKALVERANELIASSPIGEIESENSERKRGELERLSHFSNIVSELEQQIGGLIRDRQECDENIESIVEQLNEIEDTYNKEKEDVEKQVSDKIENNTDEEMKFTEERFVRCEALVGSYYQIKDVIHRIVETSKCDKVHQYVEASDNIERQVKVINKQKIEKQDEIDKVNEDLHSMSTEKERIGLELYALETQEKQIENELNKEKVTIETRLQEIDNLLAILNEDVRTTMDDYDSITRPLEKSVSSIEQDLNNMTNSTFELKKHLGYLKKNLEEIEASYTGKISQVRAQRQHLRHRLELKLQAVENVKNCGADIIMRTIKPSGDGKNENPLSKSGYYTMYMKHKDPNALEDFDDEFYAGLANTENSQTLEEDHHMLEQTNETLEDFDFDVLPKKEDLMMVVENTYSQQQPLHQSTTTTTTATTPKKPSPNTSTVTITNPIHSISNNNNVNTTNSNSTNMSRVLASKQYKLFGPNSKPLSKQDVQFVLDRFQFLCTGTLLHRKKSNTDYVLRHVCLSQEFTRILIRDNKKKVPESFLKVEHIDKVSKSKDPTSKTLEGGFSFVIGTDKNKMEFVTFDENDYNNWMDGLGLLIENKQNLFSLRYNIRDLVNNNVQ